MPTFDPIDLDAIKQAVFRENLPKIFNYVYFWMITDQDGRVLSCSSPENVKSILNSQKIHQATNGFTTSSIELIVLPNSHIAIALEVNSFKMEVNNQIVFIKLYDLMKNTNIKFRVFHSDFFIRDDRFGNKLDFFDSIDRLRYAKPWESFTDHEWTVTWLIIHKLTNPEIAEVTNKNFYTIKDTVERVLGMNKLDLYDRNLLSDVGLYLHWDCYIPLSLVNITV
ncbi:TPA: hypothetical protein ACS781_003893 [Providencia alcalifaciens]